VSGASGREPVSDLEVLRRELELFDSALAAKPQIIAANKIDAISDDEAIVPLQARAGELELPFIRISGVSGAGLPELLELIWRYLQALPVETNTDDDGADAGRAGPGAGILNPQE